jgi:hypothetical protein
MKDKKAARPITITLVEEGVKLRYPKHKKSRLET